MSPKCCLLILANECAFESFLHAKLSEVFIFALITQTLESQLFKNF